MKFIQRILDLMNHYLGWKNCSKMVFMGTSFSANITNIALEIAMKKIFQLK